MYDEVDCPYCGHTNDMSDALCDGCPSDNKMDWECQKCEKEFEVEIEFQPMYSAMKIEHIECDVCGKKARDIYDEKRIFPFPSKLKGKKICHSCWISGVAKDME